LRSEAHQRRNSLHHRIFLTKELQDMGIRQRIIVGLNWGNCLFYAL
jgi:hypothetical protein